MLGAAMRPTPVSLRWLLAAVTVLASLIFVVSVGSFGRLLRFTSEQRFERARDTVQRELGRLVAEEPGSGPLRLGVIGMRGGVVARPVEGGAPSIRTGISADADATLSTLAAVAPHERPGVASIEAEGGTVFLAARARVDERTAWAAYTVAAPRFLGAWRSTVLVLTLATVLLAVIALAAVVVTTRGARALTRSLSALEGDLSAPIPRPALAELASVAEGVDSLARKVRTAQREGELLAAELRRQERLATLGRVVAGVAHEVRNPLTSMKLRVDVARSTPGVPGEVATELEAIDEEIVRLDRLVTDFLVVSGRRIGRRVDCDLGELARRRVAELGPWARERGVAVVVEGSARAQVDGDACARAVDNLVKNAVEASPAGAEVRVRVEARGAVASMIVEDPGPGVPEARAHELFEPFFTTKPDGTGLGLAVSRAIAVASGGQLSYRRDGGVTRFELTFATEGSAT
jgi:signal transduction histidine kinase